MVLPRPRPEHAAILARAARELGRHRIYPRPVRTERVRIVVAPWLFRLPGLRRFEGYTAWNLILLRREPADLSLIVHELCHVWQMQHHPVRMPVSYLRTGYAANPFEAEARRVAGHPPAVRRGGRVDAHGRPRPPKKPSR